MEKQRKGKRRVARERVILRLNNCMEIHAEKLISGDLHTSS